MNACERQLPVEAHTLFCEGNFGNISMYLRVTSGFLGDSLLPNFLQGSVEQARDLWAFVAKRFNNMT